MGNAERGGAAVASGVAAQGSPPPSQPPRPHQQRPCGSEIVGLLKFTKEGERKITLDSSMLI